MNLSDLLDVELYNDSLKMFNQVQEGTSVALENVVFSHKLDCYSPFSLCVALVLAVCPTVHALSFFETGFIPT